MPRTPRSQPPPALSPGGVVVYEAGGDLRLDVRTDGETVWLTQEQMARLVGRDKSVITRHVANAFKEGEVDERNNMQILHFIRRGSNRSKPAWTTLSSS